MKIKVGDIIVNSDGDRRLVLAVLENLVFMSLVWGNTEPKEDIDACKKRFGVMDTIEAVERGGWKVEEKPWVWTELSPGDTYWTLGGSGAATAGIWDNDTVDIFRAKSNNVFPTEAAAKEAYTKIMTF